MGILEITVKSAPKTSSQAGTGTVVDVDTNKEALKLITFILYYAYYNTFEYPLN